MKITVIELPVADSEGKVNKTTIENYHCLSCGLFAGSVERPAALGSLSAHYRERNIKEGHAV